MFLAVKNFAVNYFSVPHVVSRPSSLRPFCRYSSTKDSKMKVPCSRKLRFVRTSVQAYPPVKGSKFAAGYDLRSAYDCVVPARGKFVCQTDLKVAVPEGCYGRVAPRSGLTVKNFIDVGAGVVDHDYRGLLGVVLFNFGEQDFDIKRGDRIAQFICEKISYPELEEVDELDDTDRGENGFGSTGKQ